MNRGPLQTEADIFLRLSEPPAHDGWRHNKDLSENYKQGARARINDMWSEVTRTLRDLTKPSDIGSRTEPLGLVNLLQMSAAPKAILEPGKFEAPIAQLEDGRWTVTGSIRVFQEFRTQELEARPRFELVPESGSRVSADWDEFNVVEGTSATYSEETRRLTIPPKTPKVRFEAVVKSNPTGLDFNRCIADIRCDIRVSPHQNA